MWGNPAAGRPARQCSPQTFSLEEVSDAICTFRDRRFDDARFIGRRFGPRRRVEERPQVGEFVGAFQVVKAAGAPDDGVKDGDQLCYRCKLGNRPAVMVFARNSDASLVKFVNQLDAVVAKNEDKKMASFVSLLGDKPDDLKSEAKDLAAKSKADHVAVVVPVDSKNGPEDYNISPQADITVLVYRGGKVAANHAYPPDSWTTKRSNRS